MSNTGEPATTAATGSVWPSSVPSPPPMAPPWPRTPAPTGPGHRGELPGRAEGNWGRTGV